MTHALLKSGEIVLWTNPATEHVMRARVVRISLRGDRAISIELLESFRGWAVGERVSVLRSELKRSPKAICPACPSPGAPTITKRDDAERGEIWSCDDCGESGCFRVDGTPITWNTYDKERGR